MTLVQLIPLAVTVSIVLTVFALGLGADLQDATSLVRHPGLLVRSILAMNVIMAVLAAAAVTAFDLDAPTSIAIMALAVSPLPPILPNKQRKAGGSGSYAIGLLVTVALAAIVLTPASIELLGRYFGADVHISPLRVMAVVMVSTILPLLAGMLVRRFLPGLAASIVKPLGIVGTALLAVSALAVFWTNSAAIAAAIGNGTLVVLLAFTVAGILVGHWLGGPDPDHRTDLALATGARHPGIAMAIGGLNYPEQRGAILAVVLLHLVISGIASIPYVSWRKRSLAGAVAGGQGSNGA